MNESKKRKPADIGTFSQNEEDLTGSTCSATDCTGLIPAMPSSEAELEAYEELYPFVAVKESSKD